MEELKTEVESLKQEVVRLTQELDQTSSEKIQSAQYGLVLLEEKETLESRCQVGPRLSSQSQTRLAHLQRSFLVVVRIPLYHYTHHNVTLYD